MRALYYLVIVLFLFSACKTKNKNPNQHEGKVQEILQTNSYTYLRVINEEEKEQWLAVERMEAKVGETYYYNTKGMFVTDFISKELNKTFKTLYLLDKISKEPLKEENDKKAITEHKGKVESEKEDVKVEQAEGGITIFELYKNKEKYADKKVKIRGKITKFNAEIMKTNWIHIQDGTSSGDNFDLTATSKNEFKVGDVVTIEGNIVIDKDFGYGYKYDILMENAEVIK